MLSVEAVLSDLLQLLSAGMANSIVGCSPTTFSWHIHSRYHLDAPACGNGVFLFPLSSSFHRAPSGTRGASERLPWN